MKNIGDDLKSHLASEVTNLATCWKLTRRDSTVMGFTDHDADITISSLLYKAGTGFTPSAVQSSSGLAVDNMDIEGMLDSVNIGEADLMAGLYDFAEIEVFMVNYANTAQGKIEVRKGWLGEISLNNHRFVAEVRGLAQMLNQNIGSVYSPLCRASFCDARCKLSASSYKVSATVTAVASRQSFTASALTNPNGYFNYGVVKFTSGANIGLSMEVKEYVNKRITLALPMPYNIAVSDTFEVIAGCDKSFKTCADKFGNALNFRGEPHVPGPDSILKTSSTK